MNSKYIVTIAGVVFLLISCQAWSLDDPSQATIRLMDRADAKLPDAVTNNISLPDALPTDSARAATDAITKAADNRATGIAKAEAALARIGDMLDTALENVEDRGRSDELPVPPVNPPDPPGPPNGN